MEGCGEGLGVQRKWQPWVFWMEMGRGEGSGVLGLGRECRRPEWERVRGRWRPLGIRTLQCMSPSWEGHVPTVPCHVQEQHLGSPGGTEWGCVPHPHSLDSSSALWGRSGCICMPFPCLGEHQCSFLEITGSICSPPR